MTHTIYGVKHHTAPADFLAKFLNLRDYCIKYICLPANKYLNYNENIIKMIPGKIFFTKGVGIHKDKLVSFELALRKAGIEKCNLVNVSSIFPPGCKQI